MIKNTTRHFETHDTVAAYTIDVRCVRVTDRWITWLIGGRNTVARIAPEVGDNSGSMVGVGIQKTGRGMTGTAFRVGVRVVAGWCIGRGGRLTNRHSAVVATGACSNNI